LDRRRPPDDRGRLTDYWRSVLRSGVRGETEARLRRVDGEYGWFKFTAEPLHDQSGTVVGWCGTNIDIIEQANRALQASERELTLIIETIPGFAWRSSTDGQLTYVNKRLSEYIGVPLDRLRDSGWLDYVHPDDRAAAIR
jgi:PAS domain-containing protein